MRLTYRGVIGAIDALRCSMSITVLILSIKSSLFITFLISLAFTVSSPPLTRGGVSNLWAKEECAKFAQSSPNLSNKFHYLSVIITLNVPVAIPLISDSGMILHFLGSPYLALISRSSSIMTCSIAPFVRTISLHSFTS